MLLADDVQKSSLVGTVDTVAQQVVRVTKALQEARDDEPKLNEFMIEVGMDMETAQVIKLECGFLHLTVCCRFHKIQNQIALMPC